MSKDFEDFPTKIKKKARGRGRTGTSPVTTHERVPSVASTRSVGRSRARSVGRPRSIDRSIERAKNAIDRGGGVRMHPRVVTRAACAFHSARGTRRWASVGPRGDRPCTGHRANRRAREDGDARARRGDGGGWYETTGRGVDDRGRVDGDGDVDGEGEGGEDATGGRWTLGEHPR